MRKPTFAAITYAVSDGEYVKIGKTGYHAGSWRSTPMRAAQVRAAALQVGNPRALIVVAIADGDIEQKTHQLMKAWEVRRAIGEWFECSEDARRALRRAGFVFSADAANAESA